jgi:hypothetical protein
MYKKLILLLLSMFQILVVWPLNTLQAITEEKTSTRSYFVGELGSAWQFPSDHLPIGASVGNIHFALWNTLNTEYLHWIEKNGQGLRDSLILNTHVPLSEKSALTVREDMVIEYIMKMLMHSTHPRSVLALQEVGGPLFRELSLQLPDCMRIIPEHGDEQKIEDIFIVDTRTFDILDFAISGYSFTDNNIVKLTLREKATGLKYCFIQSHVPGGPVNSLPARIEFAEKVMQAYSDDNISIVLGDMNRSSDYFLPQFEDAAKRIGLAAQPFINIDIPYPTHISTDMEASWIDNIFISNPYPQIESHVVKHGSELFEELQPTLDLLESLKP